MALRMMTLPEGLAGHCLTVICLLLSEWEGWRSKEKKGEVRQQGERVRLEGKRNHRLLWRPILQASLPRPTLQDILDSSTPPRPPPLQLLPFLYSFSCSPPFWFPTRQVLSRTLERCKSNTMSTSAFYSNPLYAHRHRLTHKHTSTCTKKIGVNHLQEGP